jgi:hypothetical protein
MKRPRWVYDSQMILSSDVRVLLGAFPLIKSRAPSIDHSRQKAILKYNVTNRMGPKSTYQKIYV